MNTNPDIFGSEQKSGHPDTLAVGRKTALKIERGYNQTCHLFQNLPWDMPELHAKFHQNRLISFGEN